MLELKSKISTQDRTHAQNRNSKDAETKSNTRKESQDAALTETHIGHHGNTHAHAQRSVRTNPSARSSTPMTSGSCCVCASSSSKASSRRRSAPNVVSDHPRWRHRTTSEGYFTRPQNHRLLHTPCTLQVLKECYKNAKEDTCGPLRAQPTRHSHVTGAHRRSMNNNERRPELSLT